MSAINTVSSRASQPLFPSNVMPCNGLLKICQVIYDIVSYPIRLAAELFGKPSSTTLLGRVEPQANHLGKITFAACSIATLYLFYSSFFDTPAPQPPPSTLPSAIVLSVAAISVLGLGYLVNQCFFVHKEPTVSPSRFVIKSPNQTKEPSPTVSSLLDEITNLYLDSAINVVNIYIKKDGDESCFIRYCQLIYDHFEYNKFTEAGLKGYRSILEDIRGKNTLDFLKPIILELHNHLDMRKEPLGSKHWEYLYKICAIFLYESKTIQKTFDAFIFTRPYQETPTT